MKSKVDFTPRLPSVLGSCLGPFAQEIREPHWVVDYKDIPNFLLSTVASHAGKLIFGTCAAKRSCACRAGSTSYEGYDFEQL